MVSYVDLSWKPTENSIVLMYEKLVDLGFTYREGKIVIVERKQRNV